MDDRYTEKAATVVKEISGRREILKRVHNDYVAIWRKEYETTDNEDNELEPNVQLQSRTKNEMYSKSHHVLEDNSSLDKSTSNEDLIDTGREPITTLFELQQRAEERQRLSDNMSNEFESDASTSEIMQDVMRSSDKVHTEPHSGVQTKTLTMF